jgi:crotonobetainyl-CoA:carnitine CoA-transferase CaiB-like acyl-CoA transferase
MGMAVSDYVTGLSAGYGILGALLARQQSGSGCKVETSLLRATLSFIGETAAGYMRTGNVPNRMARVKNAHAFAFVCKDKLPLAIHCSVPEKFWLALLKAVDRMEIAKDERFKTRDGRRQNYEALQTMLAPVFATKTRQEWLARLEADDVPAVPLYNVAEALADPQVKHLDLVEELEHPQAGKLKFIGAPVRYDGLASNRSAPPPLLGAHTLTILTDLGFDRTAIDELARQKIIRVA